MSKISPGVLSPSREILTPDEWRTRRRARRERVAGRQRMIQAATDEFPGWTRGGGTTGAVSKDCYVRQLRDMKGSMDVPAIRLTGPLLPCARARPGPPSPRARVPTAPRERGRAAPR